MEDKNRRGGSIKSEIDEAFTLTLRNEPISDLMKWSLLRRRASDGIVPFRELQISTASKLTHRISGAGVCESLWMANFVFSVPPW